MSFEMTLEKWILVIAAVLAVGTGLFLFPYEEQNPIVVEQYQQEMVDNVEIKDLVIDVTIDTTEEDVIKWIEENYPGFEIVEISQDGTRYIVRIRRENK
jgi:hypothetical protein